MKRGLLLIATVFFVNNHAQGFPVLDSFTDRTASGGTTYAVGSDLAGQSDGTGAIWNAILPPGAPNVRPVIAAGNLTSTTLPRSSGNSVTFAGAAVGKGTRLNFNNPITTTTTQAYYSYLLKITDISAVTENPDTNFFAGFSDGSGAQNAAVLRVAARVVTRKVGVGGTNYVLGMSRNNVPSDSVYDTNVFNLNDVVFVVGEYDRIGGVTNVNLWINPPSDSYGANTPPPPAVCLTNVTSFAGDVNASATIAGFVVLCQNVTAPTGVIDDVRIGTNWSFVTGGDPAVLAGPTNRVVAPGNAAVFSVTARGTAALIYQWYKDGTTPLVDGGNISGAASATLTLSAVSAADVGSYAVFVTNGLGSFVQSGSASLALLTDPIINNQPQDTNANFGSSASFQIAASGTAPLNYQWHRQALGDLSDGPNITGSRSNILTLSSLAFSDGDTYWVTVSNANGTVDSANAVLTVFDPYIASPPVSVTTNAGAVTSFHVVAPGSGTLTYQWLKNGTLLFDGGNISGAATDTLTLGSVSAADQAGYSVAVFGNSSTTSSVATLTVLSPVAVTIQPRDRTVLSGTRAVFAVLAGGSGPFTYQWQREGTNLPGATAAGCVLTNAQPELDGNYAVVISNSFSSITSAVVTLNVTNRVTLAETNLVMVRIGDGAETLGLTGNSMYLDQYTPGGAYVNTIAIPDDGPMAMTAIGWDNVNGVQSGSTTETILTRSLDGRFMVVAGYHTNLNYGSSLNTSLAGVVPRAIGLVDSEGQFALPVSDTNSVFDACFWRAGITDGTNNYWGGANITGTYYFGFDAPPALVQNTMVNMRSMALFNGDIYAVGAGTPNGVLKLSGMPRTNSTPTLLFSGSTGSFDLAVSPDGNLIYLADQRNLASGGGIQRYDFDGSAWTLSYTLNSGFANVGPRYIAADFSGANPVLYVTSNDQSFDNNRLIQIVDTGAGSTGTTLAYAGVNETFRSIRLGPVPNFIVPQPLLSITQSGTNLILSWTGAATLQSATNLLDTFQDLSNSSPYTNGIEGEPQRFFRLRQ